MRFSKIVSTTSDAGLYFKIPFVDEIRKFPDTKMIYDIPPSEVLTSDQKNMTVDSYVIWEIEDPLTFFKTLGKISEAELRLNAITYIALKTRWHPEAERHHQSGGRVRAQRHLQEHL